MNGPAQFTPVVEKAGAGVKRSEGRLPMIGVIDSTLKQVIQLCTVFCAWFDPGMSQYSSIMHARRA